MKHLILIFGLVFTLNGFGQGKYLTKTGTVTFEASVPSFEEVKATNANTTAILNSDNGEFAALVLVKGFRFKNALMEEHFNENYAESDDYPKATFKGSILDFDVNDIDSNKVEKTFNGTMQFHGKTNELKNQKLEISKDSDGNVLMSGTFIMNVDDYNIEIPKIVSNKLSNDVSVIYTFVLSKK